MGEGSKLLSVLSLESKEVQKYLKDKSWQGGKTYKWQIGEIYK